MYVVTCNAVKYPIKVSSCHHLWYTSYKQSISYSSLSLSLSRSLKVNKTKKKMQKILSLQKNSPYQLLQTLLCLHCLLLALDDVEAIHVLVKEVLLRKR